MRRLLIPLLVLIAALLPGQSMAAGEVRLAVPYRSQLDGNPWAESDCGPASMAMIVAAYGKNVPTMQIRGIVNDLQGTWDYTDAGSLIENLAIAAQRYQLRPLDLFKPDGKTFRRWSMADLRRHLDAGHPVVPQVWYRGLPGRENREYNGDHYVVITGYAGDEFVYNDPVDRDGPGANRRITTAQLDKAWRNSDFPYAALAVAGPATMPGVPRATPVPPTAVAPAYGVLRPVATPGQVAGAALPQPSPTPKPVLPTATPMNVPDAAATALAASSSSAHADAASSIWIAPTATTAPVAPVVRAVAPKTESDNGAGLRGVVASVLALGLLGAAALFLPWRRGSDLA